MINAEKKRILPKGIFFYSQEEGVESSILQTKANRQLRDSEETAEERTRG